VPYLVDFDFAVKSLYKFTDLNVCKTIWIRIHVIASSFLLFLGPVQVWLGVRRLAHDGGFHKYLGYTYTVGMVISLFTCPALIVLRYLDGGPWVATPLLVLTVYQAVTLCLGIRAIIYSRDKPTHRRMLFRNYSGVFCFVTFRMGGMIGVASGFQGPLPFLFMLLTFGLAEWVLWKFPRTFQNSNAGDWRILEQDDSSDDEGGIISIE
jgi:hypothetical protein